MTWADLYIKRHFDVIGGGEVAPTAFSNFLTSTSLPSWLTFTATGHRMVYDSTGKLTWAPNNLALNSDFPTSWRFNSGWTDSGTTTDPLGGSTAHYGSFTSGGYLYAQTSAAVAPGTYIFSVWVKGTGNIGIRLADEDASPDVSSTVTLTSSYSRVYVTLTITDAAVLIFGFDARIPSQSSTISGCWGWQLERVTYETAPRTYNATTSAAYYGPRFDYDPATLAARGLLIEEQRTNLLSYSTDPKDASWTNNALITRNTTTSPDGTTNAATLTASGGSGNISKSVSSTSGAAYCYSCYVKYINHQWVGIQLSDSGVTDRVRAWFDLQNGVKGTTATTGGGAVVGYDIIAVGNGWYRIWLAATNPITTLFAYAPALWTADGNNTIAANGQAAYIYGPQLELGSFPTSYIPTTTGSVTRVAETVTFGGSAQTLLQGATYSAIMEFVSEASADASRLIGNSTNTASPIYRVNSTTIGAHDGTNSLSAATAVSFDSTTYRFAYGQSAAGRSITSNNTAVSTGTDANYTAANAYTWLIGQYSGTEKWSGWVRGLSFYNVRLSDGLLKIKSTVGGSY